MSLPIAGSAAPALEPFAKLSIFYPMWNEEEYIERALDAGRRACDGLVRSGEILDYELIVVDDASTDSTGAIADRIAADDPRVRVVHHERNRKLGGAMKTGFATATGDLILYTDADLPFDMAELPRAVRLLRDYDADIVSAYRFDRTGEGYLRSVYTFVYNLLIRTLFDVKARDINFAFKLCRARIFDHVELTQRGLVHRRRARDPLDPTRLRDAAVRRRLLPAHARRVDAQFARRDRHDHARDVEPACATSRRSNRLSTARKTIRTSHPNVTHVNEPGPDPDRDPASPPHAGKVVAGGRCGGVARRRGRRWRRARWRAIRARRRPIRERCRPTCRSTPSPPSRRSATSSPIVKTQLDRTLGDGVTGDDVRQVQQRLTDLGFWPGPVDGVYGDETIRAVWAYEKLVLGVPRDEPTGQVTPEMWDGMQDPFVIAPRRTTSTPNHVEIYLPEQVVAIFHDDAPVMITHMSSGNNEEWCEEVTISPGEYGNQNGTEPLVRGECGGLHHAGRRVLGGSRGGRDPPERARRDVRPRVLQLRHRHPRSVERPAAPGVARVHPHPAGLVADACRN